MFQRISIGLVACLLAAGSCLADSLKDLEQSYLSRYDEAIGKQKSQIEKLQASYLTALKREMGKVQSTGKLEAVIPFRDEIAFVEDGKDPLPALPTTTVYQLKKMRSQFADARQNILLTNATTLVGLADKMVEVLEQRETELTKAGKIDEALAAKKMREIYAEDENIMASRNLLKFSGAGGEAKPAMRIRRYGDNIEVLVRYDSKGKLSMDSPVENVKEETEPAGEKGDTNAKVLGEFVGANGYEVDPWIAYHQVFDGKDTGGFTMAEIETKFQQEHDGEKAVALSFKPAAINPYGNLGALAPPISTPGTYRISCRYYVPRSNRAITGFQFVQAVGNPVGNRIFEDTGKWKSDEVTASSSNKESSLLFYLKTAEGKKPADGPDDKLLLRELKVEILKFPAFVVERFGEHGGVEERSHEPSKQKTFIADGDFVK